MRSNRGGKNSINWLRWEKLVVQKEYGGLGFRDLHGFNLAILGKLCQKFISNPEAIYGEQDFQS